MYLDNKDCNIDEISDIVIEIYCWINSCEIFQFFLNILNIQYNDIIEFYLKEYLWKDLIFLMLIVESFIDQNCKSQKRLL